MNIRLKKPGLKQLIILLAFVLLIVGVILGVREVQKRQDIRQRAQVAPGVCAVNQPTDTIILFDRSESMSQATSPSDPTSRMTRAKEASMQFIDILASQNPNQEHQTGLVALAGQSKTVLERQLTPDLNLVKSSLNSLTIEQYTCIECAAKLGNQEFSTRGRQNVKKVAILLTDGGATDYIGLTPPTSKATDELSEQRAFDEIMKGHNEQGIVYYTIGFGADAKEEFLQEVATQTGGKYFFAPTANELDDVFNEISTIIGKGSISGYVFNDGNKNGVKDENEKTETSWNVNIYDGSSSLLQTLPTDNEGMYSFTGYCDGSYRVEAASRSNWELIVPQSQSYNVTISNGASVSDQIFGFYQTPPFCPIEKGACSWDVVENAAEYQVVVNEIFPNTTRPPVQILSQTVIPPEGEDSAKIIFDIQPDKTYECRVIAKNSCGSSPEATTQSSCPLEPTDTPTPSPTLPPSVTPSITLTVTPSPSPTLPPGITPTDTPIPSITPSPTRVPTATRVPTLPPQVGQPIPTTPPVAINTPEPTSTPGPTLTPVPTNTPIPTVFVPSSTPRPTIVPTGSSSALNLVAVTAGVLTVIGILVFLVF